MDHPCRQRRLLEPQVPAVRRCRRRRRQRRIRGQLDGIGVRPRLRAADARGATLVDRKDSPTAILRSAGRNSRRRAPGCAPSTSSIRAIGHRVVHGGPDYDRPVLIDAAVLDRLAALRVARAAAPAEQPRADPAWCWTIAPEMPQVACFDTAFHRGHPASPTATPFPARSTTRACAATASTASPTSTLPSACPRWRPRSPAAGSSSRISAAAPRCARCRGGPQHREHHGLHRARRPADGHAARVSSTPASCST